MDLRILKKNSGNVILCLVLTGNLCAQTVRPNLAVDSHQFATFVDSLMPVLLKSSEVPGAVVVAVQSGNVFFRRGYGLSNVETQRSMDPGETVMRIASVSKPVTAVLVMQLVEAGRIGLNDDIDPFLGAIKLRDPFPQHVKLRHLLTHTAGIDKLDIGRLTRESSVPVPLAEYLQENTPPVVRPPGDVFAYSNHGFALAGQIVATLHDSSFATCARKYLFEPLSMRSSSFEITPDLRARLAIGYRSHDGRFEPVPVDLVNTIPASMMVTTADDFAKLLVFMLRDSTRFGNEVLSASSLKAMTQVQFKNHDALPDGYGYGLFVRNGADGHDWIWHSGDMRGWSAEMDLYPNASFGIFSALNSDNGVDMLPKLMERLQTRFFGFQVRDPERRTNFNRRNPTLFRGCWVYINDPVSSIEKVASLFDDGIQVHERGGDTLAFDEHPYVEIAPLVFQQTDKPHSFLAFKPIPGDDDYYATTGIRAYRRLPWYDHRGIHRALLALSLAGWFTIVIRLFTLFNRKRLALLRDYRLRWGTAVVVFVCFFIFFVGFIMTIDGPVRYGLPISLKIILSVAALGVLFSLLLPILAIRHWRTSYTNQFERWHFIVISVCALIFSFELWYWRIIG